ncbi:MAG: tRNA 2-selenouridine(34) synthase MnmH [Betaproteobacteria bacterium RIFCSPLOWO2_12_FULL_65_14]|nr:MAG: tRNA 2-selenouridine(34) synthase MnmH [Betaproteobacteria bacterium RIFCSPLOWO2_12_FULL_65_14]
MKDMDFSAFDAIIDCRSPAEYAEDHIPGAISAPVLDDAERAAVGTMYKQVSPFDAKKRGAALVAKNVARHVETLFADKPRGWRPLVYCWRGGKRSGAMAHILREIGWDARALEGGYRAYRRWVVDELEKMPARYEFVVIHGPTGSGKSRLLAALREAGAQVLDLEGLAAHRGSVLGELPGQPQPTQKGFESLLRHALSRLDAGRPVFVEGESKKIGQRQVPEALIARMRASECLLLDTAPAARVQLLTDEYRHFLGDTRSLERQLDCLVALHGQEKIASWKSLAARGAWEDLVTRLLAEHYDPAYRRSATRNFARLAQARSVRIESADATAFREAARSLMEQAVPA